MTEYTDIRDMTPQERFQLVDTMATQLFGTKRWKAEFARAYDLTPQAINKWMNDGAPVWAVVALADAIHARKWQQVRGAVLDIDGA